MVEYLHALSLADLCPVIIEHSIDGLFFFQLSLAELDRLGVGLEQVRTLIANLPMPMPTTATTMWPWQWQW